MNINTESVVTTVKAVCVLVVQVFAVYGITLDYNALLTVASAVVGLAATIWAIWNNFNFTKAAQEGQLVTDRIKAEMKEGANA